MYRCHAVTLGLTLELQNPSHSMLIANQIHGGTIRLLSHLIDETGNLYVSKFKVFG